ncbi:MAG: 50S ribosomal protein L29 [Bryobacteraceae bacterium]|jgi:large subunit ribosomal protein L29|nr:50S ribosomal protein L29 [Solibacteraceae bacterium]MCL4841407.1 50S ribosomal protein L29 [Bryobacteraceae bacterium]MCO5350795.1 50S ribosomal protein L29 [Bryobacteraceae bacterium]HAX42207.1 50S ribosomal protein L29 [Bryobacterales bacterium]HRJ19519.1 50S ribosomal protein L29 [Bryobacteraceae bacterium]
MKADKVRGMNEKELDVQLQQMDEQLFRLRFQMSMGQTEGLKKYREVRKDKARLLTVKRERQLESAKKESK